MRQLTLCLKTCFSAIIIMYLNWTWDRYNEGVPQGATLGPIIFFIFTNAFLVNIRRILV